MNKAIAYIEIGRYFFWPTLVLTFIGCWLSAMGSFGFLLGFGLGWIPSLIIAYIFAVLANFLWPIIVLILGMAFFLK